MFPDYDGIYYFDERKDALARTENFTEFVILILHESVVFRVIEGDLVTIGISVISCSFNLKDS